MSDVYTEFREALYGLQHVTGLGAIRLGQLLGVSRDMMKSLLTGRRRPGFRTITSVAERCEAGLREIPSGPVHDAAQRLRDAALPVRDAMAT